eukprot:m.70402 g.70402  ORF g.70402 m.70402 type:complete len:92 (-) comp50134_c0_seq1:182-457(-)
MCQHAARFPLPSFSSLLGVLSFVFAASALRSAGTIATKKIDGLRQLGVQESVKRVGDTFKDSFKRASQKLRGASSAPTASDSEPQLQDSTL